MSLFASALRNKATLLLRSCRAGKSNRVAYVGYVGRQNFGDELLMDIYRRISGQSTIPVLDSFSFQPRLDIPSLLGGGTVIGGPIYLAAFKRLGLMPRRVFCAGVIPGAIGREWRELLSGAEIFTRSTESCERVTTLGLDATAFVDPAVFCKQVYRISERGASGALLAPHGRHPHLETFSKIVEALEQSERADLRFFASSPEDTAICRQLQARYGGRVIYGWRDLRGSLNDIASSSFVISTRLHAAICAASCGVPVRMIAYDAKHEEFANSIEAPYLLVPCSAKVLEDLRGERRGSLPGVVRWHERFDEFRDRFSQPL